MALSKEEELELQSLKAEGVTVPAEYKGLTPSEYAELQALKAEGVTIPSEPQVSNTQLDIPWKDRFAAKNYTGSPEAALGMLEKLHPKKDFILKDGEVYGKNKGSAGPYNPIDPSGFDWADITDVGTDMIKGASAGAGTAAGFAMGGPFGAYLGGGAAMSVAEQLKQALGAAAGIENNFNPTQSTIDLMTGGLPLENTGQAIRSFKYGDKIMNGAGALAAPVMNGLKTFGNAAGGVIREVADYLPLKLAGFSADENAQYLKNRPEVNKLVEQMGSDKGFHLAEDTATSKLEYLNNILLQLKDKYEEKMKDVLTGKTHPVELKKIEILINGIDDPFERSLAQETLKKAKSSAMANRPFEPVTEATKQVQPILRGLKNFEGIPVVSSKGQVVIDPTTKVARVVGDVNFDPSTGTSWGSSVRSNTGKSRSAQMKWGDIGGQGGTAPTSNMWEAPVETTVNEVIQEPLLQTKYRKQGEELVDSNIARKLQQILDEQSGYKKAKLTTGKSEASNRTYTNQANRLREELRKVAPEVLPDVAAAGKRADLQKLLEDKIGDPLSFLKSMSDKNRAALSRVLHETGDSSTLDLMNQLGAAREILDLTDGNKHGLIKRIVRKPLARGALQANEFISNIPSNIPDSNIWNAIMSQEINKRMSTKNEK